MDTSASHSSFAFLTKSFGWLRLASRCSLDARIFKMTTRRIFASHFRTKHWTSCTAKCSAAFFISPGLHFRADAVVRICCIRRSERSLPQNLRARAARQCFCTRTTACPNTCGSGGGNGTSTSGGRRSSNGPSSSLLLQRLLFLPRVDGNASSGISKMAGLRPFDSKQEERRGGGMGGVTATT
jgi:hypothetical protein